MVRCAACGLVYRDPPRAPERTARPLGAETLAYEERVASRRRRAFQRFLAVAGPPGRLLDVGTGLGLFLKLAGEVGWQATGVDLDAAIVDHARRRLGVDARVGALADLDLPAGAFDLVTLWNVLECVSEPRGLLHHVRRVLRPGGRLFARTQNVTWQLAAHRLVRRARPAARPLLERAPWAVFIFNDVCYAPATLRRLLADTGFHDIRVRNSPPIPGDPYLGFRAPAEAALGLAKRAVHLAAEAVALASGGRWLIGPSLEAWARRAP